MTNHNAPAGNPCAFCRRKPNEIKRVFQTQSGPICNRCCREWLNDYLKEEDDERDSAIPANPKRRAKA